MHYVYVLRRKLSGEIYVGYTSNLVRRIKEHLKNFPDDQLIYYEAYLYEKNVRNRERGLKYYGSAWRALKSRIDA